MKPAIRFVHIFTTVLGLTAMASYANAAPPSFNDLAEQYEKADAETNANIDKVKALDGKADQATYCTAIRATHTSVSRKVSLLRQMNAIVKDEPKISEQQKKVLTDEETRAKESQGGLDDYLKANCGAADPKIVAIDDMTDRLDAAIISGKAHLNSGLSLIKAGDKVKGCGEMKLALKDYETQLVLSKKLTAIYEKDPKFTPDMIVKMTYANIKTEDDIKDIKAFIESSCEAQALNTPPVSTPNASKPASTKLVKTKPISTKPISPKQRKKS